MTSDRPYEAALSPATAVAELNRCSGTQFDPEVVAALGRILADGIEPETISLPLPEEEPPADPFTFRRTG